jgi:hypothetical protein
MATGDASDEAFTREAAGDGTAGGIAGTDHQGDFGFRHEQLPTT